MIFSKRAYYFTTPDSLNKIDDIAKYKSYVLVNITLYNDIIYFYIRFALNFGVLWMALARQCCTQLHLVHTATNTW